MNSVEKDIDRFFDELQAHIICVGGQKIPVDFLKRMSVNELLLLCYPNAIRFNVYAVIIKDGE